MFVLQTIKKSRARAWLRAAIARRTSLTSSRHSSPVGEAEGPKDLPERQLVAVVSLIGISGSWGGESPYSSVFGVKLKFRLVGISSRVADGRWDGTSKRTWLAGVT